MPIFMLNFRLCCAPSCVYCTLTVTVQLSLGFNNWISDNSSHVFESFMKVSQSVFVYLWINVVENKKSVRCPKIDKKTMRELHSSSGWPAGCTAANTIHSTIQT